MAAHDGSFSVAIRNAFSFLWPTRDKKIWGGKNIAPVPAPSLRREGLENVFPHLKECILMREHGSNNGSFLAGGNEATKMCSPVSPFYVDSRQSERRDSIAKWERHTIHLARWPGLFLFSQLCTSWKYNRKDMRRAEFPTSPTREARNRADWRGRCRA